MAAKITLNSAGIQEILMSAATRAMLTDSAQAMLAAAQRNAPVSSGAYRDSLHIEQATTDRAVTRVVSNLPYAMVVEANTGNLARALDAG